ncbi:MAG: NADH-quinone oxidoreductase subunit C [Betaproteobacteria bacterium]|nr:NADH-quinone oxidoreductase subunit C [Betaproteobacteria bacterium]
MHIPGLSLDFQPLGGAAPAALARVNSEEWNEAARMVHESGRALVALWGTDNRDRDGTFSVFAAFAVDTGLAVIDLPIASASAAEIPCYPDLSGMFPVAGRMQRALYDLLGLRAADASDQRNWLRHAAWPEGTFPLRRDFERAQGYDNPPEVYPFVRVEGEGVHEIPVGPIHAGIIEPGHFRFSIVGEKVLRLEERLGFTHKGIDKRFESFTVAEGGRLAGRVSGDSTVAYAWAYAQAAESLMAVAVPARATWLRALMLERERVANHLGDLGALGNDAAFSFGLSQFMRLKEDWLRWADTAFGHRFMMDCIVPGGVACDLAGEDAQELVRLSHDLEKELLELRHIYYEHAGLQDRFITTGRVTPQLAVRLGLTGLAARASGQARDLRAVHPCAPYDELDVKAATRRNGDAAARVTVRFDELFESLRLIRLIPHKLPAGALRGELPVPRPGAMGIGWVEGWRGEVMVFLEAGEGGMIRRGHAHDPSWQNWPILEHAAMDNIVPDFPLINKSFNLSYSGHDS